MTEATKTKRPRKPTRTPPAPAAPSPPPKGKIAALVSLMQRPAGASLGDLMSASGWQAHSVRGAIAGTIKRKLGLKVASEKGEAGRVYKIGQETAHP